MMLPVFVLYMILDQRNFAIHMVVALGIVVLVTSAIGITMLLIGLFFMIPAVVLGEMYKRQFPTHVAVLTMILTIIVQLLLGLTVASLFGFNLGIEIERIMQESYAIINELVPGFASQQLIDEQIRLMVQLIPSYIMIIAVYYALISHWLGRKLLRRFGIDIAALPPLRTWQLPKSLVWIYVALLILSFFTSQEDSSMFTMIFYNLFPILMIAFCVQAVSFLFFVAHYKGWNRLLPIVGIIVCLYATALMSLVGVLDIVFDLRKRIQGNRS